MADLLRSLRRSVGMTQRALALRSGVAERTISDLERGIAQTPQAGTLDLLADGLGLGDVDRARLFDAAGRPAAPKPVDAPILASRPWAELRRPLRGRDGLLAAVEHVALPGTLVTLTGPVGIGKSRLALEVARRAEARGVVVRAVELALVDDAGEALRLVGAALDALAGGTTPIALAAALDDRPTLLLLDNADHLAAAAPDLVALAAGAGHLSVLATSRAPFGVAGEVAVAVPPLPVPRPGADLDALAGNPAVLLFDDRARQSGAPDLLHRPEGVARVVARLDGVPLAIELAAAQAGTLSPAAILAMLEHAGIDLLRAPGSERERQDRMDRAIGASVERLSPPGQRLLSWLGAFADGFPLEGLAAVASDLGAPDHTAALPELVRAGLVHETVGEGRFGMLEPIRLYAEARLAGSGEGWAVRRAHAAWVGRWARRVGAALEGPRLGEALAAADADRANAFAAARWSLANREAGLAASVVLPLARLWEGQGLFDPLGGFVAALAEQVDAIPDRSDRVLARWFAAYVPIQTGDLGAAGRAVERLRDGEGDDPASRGLALLAESIILAAGEEFRAAIDRLERADALLLEACHPYHWFVAVRLGAELSLVGEPGRARRLLEGVLADFRARGDAFNPPAPLIFLAPACMLLGDLDAARAANRDLLDLSERHGYAWPRVLAIMGMAQVDCASADRATAERGVRLYGATDALLARLGLPYGSVWGARREGALRQAEATLGDAPRVDALLAQGRRLTVAEAADLAGGRRPAPATS